MRLVGFLAAGMIVLAMTGMVVMANAPGEKSAIDEDEISPGAAVSSAVAAGEAEMESEVEVRAFGQRLQAADGPSERAQLIADRMETNEETLDALENRSAELDKQLAAGTISQGQYLAELVKLSAMSTSVERTTTQSATAAAGLEDKLQERGITSVDFEEIRDRARGQGPPANTTIPGLSDDHDLGPHVNVSTEGAVGPDRSANASGPPDR